MRNRTNIFAKYFETFRSFSLINHTKHCTLVYQSEKLHRSINRLILVTLITRYKLPQNNMLSVSLALCYSHSLYPYLCVCRNLVAIYMRMGRSLENSKTHHMTKKAPITTLRHILNQNLSKKNNVFENLD